MEVAAPAKQVDVTVQSLPAAPASAPALPSVSSGSAFSYKYMQMEVQGASVKQAFVTYTVEDKWLVENDADPATVKLNRLHDGEWRPLETRAVGRTHDGFLYESTTPGFSIFVVTAEKTKPPTPTPTLPPLSPAVQAPTPPPTPAPTPPAKSPGFEAVFAIGALAVALFLRRRA